MKESSAKTFQALNEFVQIAPIKDDSETKSGIITATVAKRKPARGTVVSIGEGRHLADGTFIKPPVAVGDEVVYNPHMVGYELKHEGQDTIIISTNGIYGKMV